MLGFVVWATLLFLLRARSVARGVDLAWLADDAPLTLTANVVAGVAMVICWIGSVFVWARSTQRGVIHGVALIMLIFLGVFVGPFYILLALRTVPEVRPNEAAA